MVATTTIRLSLLSLLAAAPIFLLYPHTRMKNPHSLSTTSLSSPHSIASVADGVLHTRVVIFVPNKLDSVKRRENFCRQFVRESWRPDQAVLLFILGTKAGKQLEIDLPRNAHEFQGTMHAKMPCFLSFMYRSHLPSCIGRLRWRSPVMKELTIAIALVLLQPYASMHVRACACHASPPSCRCVLGIQPADVCWEFSLRMKFEF
jgi:hypothetical protein